MRNQQIRLRGRMRSSAGRRDPRGSHDAGHHRDELGDPTANGNVILMIATCPHRRHQKEQTRRVNKACQRKDEQQATRQPAVFAKQHGKTKRRRQRDRRPIEEAMLCSEEHGADTGRPPGRFWIGMFSRPRNTGSDT